jgi:acetylornithine aminotransferase
MIFDEIQTGMGRTGRLFAYQHLSVEPDIMTLAKALANGLPIGAMLAKEEIAAAFGPGAHASTFGGTPIVTAAALEACKILTAEKIIEKGHQAGRYLKEKLYELKDRHAVIEDVRGMGLLLGMKLKTDGGPLVAQCMEKGFLINCIQDNILRFIPPLIISHDEIDQLIGCLDKILAEAASSGS